MSETSKHACFYIDTVTFRVEDCLFKVPREPFKSESIPFRDMFLLPVGDSCVAEGRNDEDPIHLIGIQKDEFEQLLSVLFHRTHGVYQNSLPETSDQWTFVLKLASLWGFDTIRQIAIDHLKKSVSAVDRIVLAEMYDLDFESWSLHAMHVIVRRHRPISVAEGQRIGIEMALKLASVRERAQSELLQAQWKAPGRRPNVETLDFTQILRETFKRSSG